MTFIYGLVSTIKPGKIQEEAFFNWDPKELFLMAPVVLSFYGYCFEFIASVRIFYAVEFI